MTASNIGTSLSEFERRSFKRDGYVVVRSLLAPEICAQMRALACDALSPLIGPAEYETDVRYPGSPASREAPGGNTSRRLLSAYARHERFRQWATGAQVSVRIRELLDTDEPMLCQSHHNCIMTKFPGFSSATNWHQDMRYWSFDRPDLVSVWLALGDEREENGALRMIPGSHLTELDRGRLDAELFLRPDLDENRRLIATARSMSMEAGDVVFFHGRLFHAAGMNRTTEVKISLVYTYHDASNHPIPDTKSSNYPSIRI
ncbi:MAG: phytanoyl-CoA dioxygenase family protein [Pseudomonadales bacterium]